MCYPDACTLRELQMYEYSVGVVSWTKKRRLFVLEYLSFLVSMVILIVLDLVGHGFSRAIVISLALLAVIATHWVLRLTYFQNIRTEFKKE